jgi:hypothetical protein
LELIRRLQSEMSSETSLVVIDPITRVIDLARREPLPWGRELIEQALPTLAALAESRRVDVVVTSECRTLPDIGAVPVLSEPLRRWSDNLVFCSRPGRDLPTEILRVEDGESQRLGSLLVMDDGYCRVSLGTLTDRLEV